MDKAEIMKLRAALNENISDKIAFITIHWSGGGYFPNSGDRQAYQLMIALDSMRAYPVQGYSPFKKSAIEKYAWAQHTWHRNSFNLGISVLSMGGNASSEEWEKMMRKAEKEPNTWRKAFDDHNYGSTAPPRLAQLEELAKATAVIAYFSGVPIKQPHIRTHEEWATEDGYGPGSGDPQTKWDFWGFGDIIRRMVGFYHKQIAEVMTK